MTRVRHVIPALLAGLVWVAQLGAQEPTGTVSGKVIDGTTQQPLFNVEVAIAGTPTRQLTRTDGTYTLTGVKAGPARVRATRIGYGSSIQDVTVSPGGATTVDITLVPAAAILEPVVVTGYGTQRREAITGSVSTVDASAANVGVVTNVDQMIQARAAGVEITQNSGEPGAGAQVLIRGGSSLSATNEPLYVIDGVPINNVPTEPEDAGAVGNPALPRNPLNLLNPSDIASITVLKDASATAIYGSRASNGVILVETKRGQATGGGPTFEYDGYVSTASATRTLDVLNGSEYRTFVQASVAKWRTDSTAFNGRHPATDTIFTKHFADSAAAFNALDPTKAVLGSANTDWANALTRSSVTHSHNLAFTGGSEDTHYRASVNYANQQGVTLSSALERIQGRLTATHSDLNNRLRIGVNVTTSRVNNTYLSYENQGGFEGGVFENVATFNPTLPITVTDSTGTRYYEVGGTSIRNPVALANQIINIGQTTRTLANGNAEFDLMQGLTAKLTVGLDHSNGGRQEYYPNANPLGQALGGGLARVSNLENTTQTLQTILNYQRQFGSGNSLDFVGGYEYNKFQDDTVISRAVGFYTDRFSFNNLGAATTKTTTSYAEESRLVSFFTRTNVGFKDRFFLTGVLRYDGSSKFAVGHKWALFPGVSGSWHLSQEEFMRGTPFSDLRLRLGWGLQGNPGVAPYTSLITLAGNTGAAYAWGDQTQPGVQATSNGNPNLKWEQTSQVDGAVDFGLFNNRISGTVEYYHKNTKDLLLTVNVAQPALQPTQLQNVGRLTGHGLELSLDAVPVSRPGFVWRAGLVFAAERTKVVELNAPCTTNATTGAQVCPVITTGDVSGQGQSNQEAERIYPGYPLGTFYGPVFLGADSTGKQIFACTTANTGASCVNGRTTTGGGPNAGDYQVIGNANPDFTIGFHSQVNWKRWDLSFLIRAAVGQDVFNNSALVYSTTSNALQGKNFLRPAATDPTGIHEPAIYSSKWVEGASFLRMQNITIGYDLDVPWLTRSARSARVYASADNLFVITGYSGLDPEVFSGNTGANPGLVIRGIDYLTYPRPRTITGGLKLVF
ncbi:MAG TPA: SusC/RagA family TonB-linked outer membrane protein [Gemmatimonadales bacterium]|nr:SusC/RagA family TonB-linked outer membrane protein [Gemmatimonadales bacterium]